MTSSPLGQLGTLAAHLAAAPVEGGLGLEPLEVGPGHLRARVPVGPDVVDADGRVSCVVLAVAADCALGVSVHTSVPGSAGGPTVELRLDLAGAPTPVGGSLLAVGRASDVGPVCGSGRVEITDSAGALVATAVGLMSIDRLVGDVGDRPVPEPGVRFDPGTLVVAPASADGSVAVAPLVDGMQNPLGTVHGGVLAALADAAQRVLRDRHGSTRSLSLTVDYLRPAYVTDGRLSAHSAFVRRGRRFQSVRTELRRPDGTVVLQATGTSLVLPA